MKFTKMHGCGNDYVYVNLFEEKLDDPARVSIYVSDRHFGIGSDGLITIGPSGKALSLIHISEPTRQAEISYAVFCLKKKTEKEKKRKENKNRKNNITDDI